MKRFVPLVVAASLAVPGTALASGGSGCNSQAQTYGGQTCQAVSNVTAAQTTATTSPASTGTLPFTGLDVGLLAAGGGTLLGAGLVVRRLARGSTD
jgi:hypothetical protein